MHPGSFKSASGRKQMVGQLPNEANFNENDGADSFARKAATQRAQLVSEARHFQRVQDEPDECNLPWSLFYSHCRGSVDLPLLEQIRLRHHLPEAQLAVQATASGMVAAAAAAASANTAVAAAAANTDKANTDAAAKVGPTFGQNGAALSPKASSTVGSTDEYESRIRNDIIEKFHRLQVAYGTKVEWYLYFKSEENMQKQIRELITSLILAMLGNCQRALIEIETKVSTAITTMLVDTLENLINQFLRRWKMVFMSDHEDSIALLRDNCEKALANLRSFLQVSRLSFLGPMLLLNPYYNTNQRADCFENLVEANDEKFGFASVASADVNPGVQLPIGGVGFGGSKLSNRLSSSNLGSGTGQRGRGQINCFISRASFSSTTQSAAAATSESLLLDAQSLMQPGQTLRREQEIWLPCKHLKMFEAPVCLVSASDSLDNGACFGIMAAFRRRCQSLIGAPCTGRLGRFCLDRRCSEIEQQHSNNRWIFVGDTYIGLLNKESNEIEEVMLFDDDFHVITSQQSKKLKNNSMKLVNNYCQLHIVFQREVDSQIIAYAIETAMSFSGEVASRGRRSGTDLSQRLDLRGSHINPVVSNGFLFSRRISVMRNEQSGLMASLSRGAPRKSYSNADEAGDKLANDEQALAAAVAFAAASTTRKVKSKNLNNAAKRLTSDGANENMAELFSNSDTSRDSDDSLGADQHSDLLRQQGRNVIQMEPDEVGRKISAKRLNKLLQLLSDADRKVPVNSFAPPRNDTKAQWYVDAGSYFYAIADAIDMAQSEIFVCSSVLAPEIYLKRPDPDGRYQLGRLLIEKAKLRVQVFILLDNPNCLKDTNTCLHVLDYFEGVPNVHIMLSPFDLDDAGSTVSRPILAVLKAFLVMRRRLYSRCFGGILPRMGAASLDSSGDSRKGCRVEDVYYKHNEKFVVIDQRVALVSGVDLTWGVWDTSLHVINDVPANTSSSMTDPGAHQYRGQADCVKAFWTNSAAQSCELTPPIMSCLDEEATVDNIENARPNRPETAIMYLPESLKDLVMPKEKLGTDSDYDNFAHTQRAFMTKPYSVFIDANDPMLNPQYFETVRLLDSRYRNAVRVAWTFQRKSVKIPELREFEAPGSMLDKIEEPAYVSEMFQANEETTKRRTAWADSDIKAELKKKEQKNTGPERLDSELLWLKTTDDPIGIFEADPAVAPAAAVRSKPKAVPWSNTGPPTNREAKQHNSTNNSNAELVSLDDLAKHHVCVAGCMVAQHNETDLVGLGLSDDSDSDDIECFPADMMQPLLRSVNKGDRSVGQLKHNSWLSHRIAVERHLGSVQRKLVELRRQQVQSQSTNETAATGSSSGTAGTFQTDQKQLYKHKQLLIESFETGSGLHAPILKRHVAVKYDGSRFTTRLFPGLDYANNRLLNLTDEHYSHPDNPPSSLDPDREPRLPIHSVGLAIFGSAARDVARHFIQRWNFACSNVYRQARKQVVVGNHGRALESFLRKPLLVPRFYVDHDLEDCELLVRRTECLRSVLEYPNADRRLSLSNQTVNVLVLNLDEQHSHQCGFGNEGCEQQKKQQQHKEEKQQPLRQTQQAQQPSQMTDRGKSGKDASGDDVMHEIASNEQMLQGANVASMPVFLSEKSVNNLEGNEMVQDEEFINCLERLSQGRLPYSCRVTVLRSLGKWSGGLYRHQEERSILQAYYNAIKTAKRFLYLESELFVSQSRNRCSATALVQNRISFYMYKRILAARQVGEPFKIYLVMPLLPKYHGRLLSGTDGDYMNRRAMHHVYSAIFRGEDSLVHRLLQRNIAPDEYLSVCSLQKYERIPDGWLAQDIYVQSNLLIADDRLAIIGSPSVTDRGLLGYKNSELAVRLEDPPSSLGVGRGDSGGGNGFVRSLRLTLWGEHLDMPAKFREAAIGDPGEAAVWSLWRGRATKNSQIMYEVFRSVPNSAANTIERLRDFTSLNYLRRRAKLYSNSRNTVVQGLEKLASFCGNLVRYSGHFLEGNDLGRVDDVDKRWRATLLWPDFSLV